MVVNKSKAAFRTIAEVAEELGVATHVLRFWETKFPQIKPMKRSAAAVITARMMWNWLSGFVIFSTKNVIPLKACKSCSRKGC